MAVYLYNSFEGGTNGGTVSTVNSGGSSGNAFNVVTIGSAATLTYSNTEAAHGSLSGKLVTPASAVNVILEWSTSLTSSSVSQAWFRAYCYMPSYPGGFRVVTAFNGSTLCGGAEFAASGSNGIIKLIDSSGTVQATGSLTLPKNAWFRIEGFVIGSATAGQVSCSVYTTMDGTTPAETDTTGATINTSGPITNLRFGNSSSAANYTFYMDDLGVSDTGYLGPALLTSTATTAIAPLAMSATVAEKFAATAGPALAPLTMHATAAEKFAATASLVLAPKAMHATATETFAATGSVKLAQLVLTATGAATAGVGEGGQVVQPGQLSGSSVYVTAANPGAVSQQPALSGAVS